MSTLLSTDMVISRPSTRVVKSNALRSQIVFGGDSAPTSSGDDDAPAAAAAAAAADQAEPDAQAVAKKVIESGIGGDSQDTRTLKLELIKTIAAAKSEVDLVSRVQAMFASESAAPPQTTTTEAPASDTGSSSSGETKSAVVKQPEENVNMTDTDIFVAGKVAVITGASSGIGRAASQRCFDLGMKVFMADIDATELERAVAAINGGRDTGMRAVGVVTDVADRASVEDLARQVFEACGACHFLMNNAGISGGRNGPMAELGKWERTMSVNFWGVVNGCQTFVPRMQSTGQNCIVVNTGSKQGITMPPGNLAYNVSKAAVKAFTEGLEHDVRNVEGGQKIRTALLVPGWTNTAIVLKQKRAEAAAAGRAWTPKDEQAVFFHEAKPAAGAWMPAQVVDFMMERLAAGSFYIICPDNETKPEDDIAKMRWTCEDICQDRPPLSRWHPEHKGAYAAWMDSQTKELEKESATAATTTAQQQGDEAEDAKVDAAAGVQVEIPAAPAAAAAPVQEAPSPSHRGLSSGGGRSQITFG